MSSSESNSQPNQPSMAITDIVVAVGTDHHQFDRMIDWVDAWAAANPEVSILVQRGTSRPSLACDSVELLAHPELCERFAQARVVVSHGGPSTVMDARMGGSRPVVVARDPKRGEHVDDHQQRFAEHLRRHGLAEVVATEQQFFEVLDEALARPEYYSVPVEASDISGVVEVGRVLDELIGTTTTLVPTSPASLLPADFSGADAQSQPLSVDEVRRAESNKFEESQR